MPFPDAIDSDHILATPEDGYGPDGGIGGESPLMAPFKPTLSPSPPPQIPEKNLTKTQPSWGDGVLVSLMDGGKRMHLAHEASENPLPSALVFVKPGKKDPSPSPSEPRRPSELNITVSEDSADMTNDTQHGPALDALARAACRRLNLNGNRPKDTVDREDTTTPSAPAQSEIAPGPLRAPSSVHVFSPHNYSSPRSPTALSPPYRESFESRPLRGPLAPPRRLDLSQSRAAPSEPQHNLPPLQVQSPRSETSLPSLRANKDLAEALKSPAGQHAPEAEMTLRQLPSPFAILSPTSFPRINSLTSSHSTPPVSPNDLYRRHDVLYSPTLTNSHTPFSPSVFSSRPSTAVDYNSATEATPSDHAASTPATTITAHSSVADHMSIDGVANQPLTPATSSAPPAAPTTPAATASTTNAGTLAPSTPGFPCSYPGCNAPPFHTQYLLSSHANVHSSDRPFYCDVPGCARSQKNKGFKRKNELIRHGLVHQSPGYVCPFCPDRDHRYPRPDNLQRHVRVHHVDRNKDDHALRDVLSQRVDGPRARRRRGGQS